MLTTELVVVKSADGTSILIPLGKGTAVDTSIKVGDWVEVVVMPDRQVVSVKKVPAAPPREAPASPTAPSSLRERMRPEATTVFSRNILQFIHQPHSVDRLPIKNGKGLISRVPVK